MSENDQQTIPVAVAAELIAGRIQAQDALARDLVLLEALAVLTAQLHRAGLVDADRLAADLQTVFEQPQPQGLDQQQLLDLVAVMGGRIRGAARGE